MPMSQERINSNLVNSMSILNKALQNIIVRQQIILQHIGDVKNNDLATMDMQLLIELQLHLDEMKKRL